MLDKIMIAKYLRKCDNVQIFGAGLDLSCLEWDHAVGSSERSYEPSGSVNLETFLSRQVINSFPRRTLLHGVS
jgi:hypothetical protein